MRALVRGLALIAVTAVWCAPSVGAPTAVGAPTVVAPTRQRTGPDSFFRWRADTVEEAIAQIESDSVLRQRLAKHFRLSQAELVSYLRKNLVIVTMPTSGWRTVYGVNSNGRIYRSRDYFHQGAKAFGLRNGTAVLKYACGNPLITELPMPRITARRPEAPPPLHSPQECMLVAEAPIVPVIEVSLARPFEVPGEQAPLAAVIAPVIAAPTAVAVAGHRAVPWLLASLPFVHSHEGEPPIPPPIHEPGSATLLTAGLAALGGLWLCRRRQENAVRPRGACGI